MGYIDSVIIENQAEITNAIDTVWVALCAALIFFMEGGFALLESGFVRSKNAMSIIAKVFIDIIFGGIIFYVVGFGIAYGSSNGWFAFDIGISENDLFITGNLFQSGSNSFNGAVVYQVEKNDGYAGVANLGFTLYNNIPGGQIGAFSLVPAGFGQGGEYGPGIYLVVLTLDYVLVL